MTVRELTRGEKLVERTLETELRAGVPHYRTGQHAARKLPRKGGLLFDVVELSYVDAGGNAILLLVSKLETGWKAETGWRCGHHYGRGLTAEEIAGLELSPAMLEALEAAR